MASELLSIVESIATWPGIVKSFQRGLPSILVHPLGMCLDVFYNDRRFSCGCHQERCSTASRACTMAAISLATSGRLASSKAKFSEVAVICPNPPRLRLPVVYGQFHEATDGRFGWLITLHNQAGELGYDHKEQRQIALDAIYMLLRVHHHLSRERIDMIQIRIGLEERLSKEKL